MFLIGNCMMIILFVGENVDLLGVISSEEEL